MHSPINSEYIVDVAFAHHVTKISNTINAYMAALHTRHPVQRFY